MKKSVWLALLLMLVCIFSLSACDSETQAQNNNPANTSGDNETHIHTFSEWIITKNATCTVNGEQERSCSCGKKESQSIEATGHTVVTDKAVAATCTTDGKTECKHCSVCNTVIVASTTVKAKGHTEVVDKAISATCTTDGKTQGKHCSVCHTVTVAQVTIKRKGHTEVIDVAVEPTCHTTGKTQGKHCSVCNTIFVSQIVLELLPHTEVIDEAVAPTCTETGLTEGKHCSVCSAITVPQNTVKSMGHDFENKVCRICSYRQPTSGLRYTLNYEGTEYYVTGIGSAQYQSIVVIPDTYNGKPVTAIHSEVFAYSTKITEVYIPNSVTSIGDRAFYMCSNLEKVSWGENITYLGASAFAGCHKLQSIIIPNTLTTIRDNTFNACYSLNSVVFGKSITSIEYNAFVQCASLTNINLPDNLISIGDHAFYKCSGLTFLTIPDKVTTIGYAAFGYCTGLISVTIGRSVNQIDNTAFYMARHVEVVNKSSLPIQKGSSGGNCGDVASMVLVVSRNKSSLTQIGDYYFYGQYLVRYGGHDVHLVLPNNYRETYQIYQGAFAYNDKIISITIPENVTKIGNFAFGECSSLEEIIFEDISTWYGTNYEAAWERCDTLNSSSINVSNSSLNVSNMSSYLYYFKK